MPTALETTHVVMERTLIVYQRERSAVWQCRYRVNRRWQRASTGEHELPKAIAKAHKMYITAEVRHSQGLPVVTRRVKHVAALAIKRMEDELAIGQGKISYETYIRIINDFILPTIGRREITSITPTVIDQLDKKRIEIMGKAPTKSTMLKHNAALNRIFDEAVIHGFLTQDERPTLIAKGEAGKVRPGFDVEEIGAVLGNFDAWIDRARSDESRERRLILKDYVHFILDTGVRPGDEPLGVRWRQVKYNCSANEVSSLDKSANTNKSEPVRTMQMRVTGKTGPRTIVAMDRAVSAFARIAERNYGIKGTHEQPFTELLAPNNEDYVFQRRIKQEDGRYKLAKPTSLENMFTSYLREHNLLIDPKTGQNRVLYSLRHAYATYALLYDRVPIHTLARQMGTSVLMIEKHYSHLDVVTAITQLGGRQTKKVLDANSTVSDKYKSTKAAKVA
jgi:integrase